MNSAQSSHFRFQFTLQELLLMSVLTGAAMLLPSGVKMFATLAAIWLGALYVLYCFPISPQRPRSLIFRALGCPASFWLFVFMPLTLNEDGRDAVKSGLILLAAFLLQLVAVNFMLKHWRLPLIILLAGLSLCAFAPGLFRSRIGCSECAPAASCKTFAEAEEIYHRTDYNKDGIVEYAQTLSFPNGLSGTTTMGEPGLIDNTFANAEGTNAAAIPKAGYFFKVLKSQGPHASGGAYSYIVNGHMTLGYALLAYPAHYYQNTRKSYIISHDGTIYATDLGEDTPVVAANMTCFDPDPAMGWLPTE